MNIWTGHSNLGSITNWNLEYATPRQATSEPVAILPPTPIQTGFALVAPPNETDNLAIPVRDLACASMSGPELQPCDSMIHPSRQARSEVLLTMSFVRLVEEVNIHMCTISPKLHKRYLQTGRHVRCHDSHRFNVEVKAGKLPLQSIQFDHVIESWAQIWQPDFPPSVPLLQIEKFRFKILFSLLITEASHGEQFRSCSP
jgi:hypothetical protein